MIFFCCPECREELEAEESIKNTRMKCPACWKEITVPEVGVSIPAQGRRPARVVRAGGGSPAGKIFLITLLVVVAGGGMFFLLRHLANRQREAERPKCEACRGKGSQECGDCRGAKTFPCKGECKGSGRVLHQPSGEETNCSDCAGAGRTPCRTCDGRGGYSCARCRGTGEGVGR